MEIDSLTDLTFSLTLETRNSASVPSAQPAGPHRAAASTSSTGWNPSSKLWGALNPDPSTALAEILSSYGPSDLRIRTSDGGEYHVHKKIEAQTGVVELLNDPPAAIRLLLQFLYTGKYNYFVNDNDEPSAPLCLFHLDVYICGVIYQLSELQKLAKASFLTALCERKTMANCVMPTAIATLYKSTPESDRGLRDYFEDYSVRHMPMLLQNPSFLELMLTCNPFRRAVARATHYQRTRVARLENHIADLQVQIKIPEFEAKQTSQKYRCPTKGCRVMMRSRRLMATDDVFCVGCKTISDTSEWKEDKSKKGRAKLKN
ncbi:hypothetical protein HDK77DRAFT_429156 [Phyllosticta capitalensis]